MKLLVLGYDLVSTISRASVAAFMIARVEETEPFRDRTPMIAGTTRAPRSR